MGGNVLPHRKSLLLSSERVSSDWCMCNLEVSQYFLSLQIIAWVMFNNVNIEPDRQPRMKIHICDFDHPYSFYLKKMRIVV